MPALSPPSPPPPPVSPLAPLLALDGVAQELTAARADVDAALAHRALRRHGGQVAAEVSLRCAAASAALEGSVYDVEAVRAGTVTDPVVQGALRVAGALGSGALSDVWRTAPRQALARLHLLAARGAVPEKGLGRPSADPAVAARLDALARLIAGLATGRDPTPPALLAAVVHGELLALKPFPGPSGVVARAAARLVLVGGGLDPRGVVAVEVGHHARGPEYVGAANAFATGTPDGLRSWFRHYAGALRAGARELTDVADGVLARA
ncbi:MAG TPA: oxidoreductase [Pilimelia sp.]|nr:oxidoreductase [Pilimelia sp.]